MRCCTKSFRELARCSETPTDHTVWSTTKQPMPRADPRFVPNQWETPLQSNGISHWVGANLESALHAKTRCACWVLSMIDLICMPVNLNKSCKLPVFYIHKSNTDLYEIRDWSEFIFTNVSYMDQSDRYWHHSGRSSKVTLWTHWTKWPPYHRWYFRRLFCFSKEKVGILIRFHIRFLVQ